MRYFPMFMDIKDKEILVCGGGSHGIEKVRGLDPFGACIRVISEEAPDGIEQQEGVTVERRRFEESDLDSFPVFVIAAEDRQENERIVSICRRRHMPVNAVDMQDICDFIFPAMILSGQLCIGISTGGASPAAAVELKKRIAEQIPDNVDEILDQMADIRSAVRERIPDREGQRQAFRCMVRQAFQEGRPLDEREMQGIMDYMIKKQG